MSGQISLRKATADDARFIAENVLRALHIEEANEQHIEHLAGICRREDTLYSWRNATIALYDNVPVGLMVAYDGFSRGRALTIAYRTFVLCFPLAYSHTFRICSFVVILLLILFDCK